TYPYRLKQLGNQLSARKCLRHPALYQYTQMMQGHPNYQPYEPENSSIYANAPIPSDHDGKSSTSSWRRFLLLWIVANLVSALLAVLNTFLFSWLGTEGDADFIGVAASQIVISAVQGAIFGWIQWFTLRRYLSFASLWIAAIAIADLISQLANQLIFHFTLNS